VKRAPSRFPAGPERGRHPYQTTRSSAQLHDDTTADAHGDRDHSHPDVDRAACSYSGQNHPARDRL